MVTVLIVPAVFGLAALSRPVVGLLFEHGETGPSEAHSIAVVLLAYLPGTLFAAYDQILIYMFYSRRSTWIPVLVGVFSVGAYFVAAALLANRYGAVGLAIANSAQFVSHTLVLGWIARKRVARVWDQFSGLLALTFAGSVACAAVAYISYRGIAGTTGGIDAGDRRGSRSGGVGRHGLPGSSVGRAGARNPPDQEPRRSPSSGSIGSSRASAPATPTRRPIYACPR